MWQVDDMEMVPIELDLTSSGGGLVRATSVRIGTVTLINALQLLDVDPDETQVLVCLHCGTPGCSSGDRVSMRRVGGRVIWIPAFDAMADLDVYITEHSPPSYFSDLGGPWFSQAAWAQLRAVCGELPRAEDLRPLSAKELAQLCQWSAPDGFLGRLPAEPRIRREMVVAVTDGELAVEVDAVDAALAEYFANDREVDVVPPDDARRAIEFWLDLPGTPSWCRFARVGGSVGVLRDDGSTLMPRVTCAAPA